MFRLAFTIGHTISSTNASSMTWAIASAPSGSFGSLMIPPLRLVIVGPSQAQREVSPGHRRRGPLRAVRGSHPARLGCINSPSLPARGLRLLAGLTGEHGLGFGRPHQINMRPVRGVNGRVERVGRNRFVAA